jgi:hypothetical protein
MHSPVVPAEHLLHHPEWQVHAASPVALLLGFLRLVV